MTDAVRDVSLCLPSVAFPHALSPYDTTELHWSAIVLGVHAGLFVVETGLSGQKPGILPFFSTDLVPRFLVGLRPAWPYNDRLGPEAEGMSPGQRDEENRRF